MANQPRKMARIPNHAHVGYTPKPKSKKIFKNKVRIKSAKIKVPPIGIFGI